jgi:outer membrane immunogenic protein
MRAIFLATTAMTLVLGSGALAADMRAAPPLKRVAPAIHAGNWSGSYFGGFAGGHWSKDRWSSDETAPAFPFGPFALALDGFSGGIISGVNIQHGNFVWGLETDLGVLTGKNNFGPLRSLFSAAEIDSIETKLRYNAHARLRFGWSMGAWMPFAAAGAAYANTRTTITDTQNGPASPDTQSFTHHRIGYTIGGGIDWMFAPNWIARAEYLHDRYLTEGFALGVRQDSQYLELNSNTVRGAVLYKFGAGMPSVASSGIFKAPVVAPAATWAGVYIGAFAGGHWSKERWSSDETNPPAFLGPLSYNVDGFTGGGLIGANVQYGNHIWGVEADVGFLSGSHTFGPLLTLFPGVPVTIDSITTKMRWNAHARIRKGYSFGSWMPFVATGIAYSNTRMTLADSAAAPPQASISLDRIGFSSGGGVDWMLHPNWIVRAEYIYDRFASAGFAVPVTSDSQHLALRSHIVRGAIMYKLGDDNAAPPVGRFSKAPPAAVLSPWTGGYAGAFAGGHWSRDRWTSDATNPASSLGGFDLEVDGFAGGGLIGANLQYGSLVWGVEADLGILTGTHTFGPLRTLFPGNASTDSIETKMRWNGHGRLRFGYAAGNWLPFLAGGIAYADTRVTNRDAALPVTVTDLNRVGFTFGGGVDWRFAANWIGRVEYLHDRYGTATVGNVTDNDSEHMELHSNIVRAALIYTFGAPVARY